MDRVRRSMDLTQHVFNITYSQKYFGGEGYITLIKLDNCKNFITVHTKAIIKRSSKHRILSVARVKDQSGDIKHLLQLQNDLYLICSTRLTDEIFKKINRYQNYWFGRNEENRLMLNEYTKLVHQLENFNLSQLLSKVAERHSDNDDDDESDDSDSSVDNYLHFPSIEDDSS